MNMEKTAKMLGPGTDEIIEKNLLSFCFVFPGPNLKLEGERETWGAPATHFSYFQIWSRPEISLNICT